MIQKILFIAIIISIIPNVCVAGAGSDSGYSFDGNGVPEYPNEGSMWASCWEGYYSASGSEYKLTAAYDTGGNMMHYYYSCTAACCSLGGGVGIAAGSTTSDSGGMFCEASAPSPGMDLVCDAASGTTYIYSNANRLGFAYVTNTGNYGSAGKYGQSFVRVTITANNTYNVSGTTACLSFVSLYLYGNEIQEDDNLTAANYYEFVHLIDGKTYTLNFSDGHEYEFTVNGADVEYDYDDCITTTYRFLESCDNLIPDSEGFYIEKIGDTVHAANYFHAPGGVLEIYDSPADNIFISASPFSGQIGWLLDPIVNDTAYDLINPHIAWSLRVIVQNESDGALIEGAMVKVDQDCYCVDGFSTRQKMTTNGMVEFGDMSLQDASLFVMKGGYKICDENSTGYAAFLSGGANFSSKTWVVKLAPSWSNNTSTFYETGNKVDIHFRNGNGNRTSQILDTDTEVYLYYENNNSENEAMTLKFQSSSTHSYFIDEDSWTIAHDDIGHKTIPQTQFTPWAYAYRAVIYNSSIYGWNLTIPLTVRNETKEKTIHYENLTTNLWFLNAKDGKIDYREDMQIVSHARSNNTTLMNIDLEVWKDGALLCYKNLTETDYAAADFPYYYIYEPVYEYVSGSNYTTKMYGFDRTLLEVRFLTCISDNVTRKNKLTIMVKNRFGTNLNNAFVYLEGYGSLPTGVNSYASYEGIDAGYYRYKATKAGYDATGWDDITMSDGDAVVVYTLTETESEAGSANVPKKTADRELKNLYIMMLSLLLIVILFGGFLYVAK